MSRLGHFTSSGQDPSLAFVSVLHTFVGSSTGAAGSRLLVCLGLWSGG